MDMPISDIVASLGPVGAFLLIMWWIFLKTGGLNGKPDRDVAGEIMQALHEIESNIKILLDRTRDK